MMAAIGRDIRAVTESKRLNCAEHIINLVVKAILYGVGITDFTKEILGCCGSRAFELWRKFGSIGKVNSTVEYIMRSDQRRQHFLSFSDESG